MKKTDIEKLLKMQKQYQDLIFSDGDNFLYFDQKVFVFFGDSGSYSDYSDSYHYPSSTYGNSRDDDRDDDD